MRAGVRIIVGLTAAVAGLGAAAPEGDGPRSSDPGVVIERFAAAPDVVTPVGVTVDPKGRVLVVESHTHFRPPGYKGPPADRIRVLEDRDGDGRGGRTGPDLSTTGAALNHERLVESIVDPNKEVAPQFTAWTVALKDGRVVTGTLLQESEDGLTFGDAEGKLVTVKPSEVEERRPQRTSVMPEGLLRQMTAQEFRDLVAYLRAPRREP
jgi:putative heme-binding domain-containing protein